MEKATVIGRKRRTGEEITVLSGVTDQEAECFCEQWGWIYDDGKDSFWLIII